MLFKSFINTLIERWNTISIADDIKEFLVKGFVLPNLFLSDVPGYLLGRFRDFQGHPVFLRNVFLPEQFFLVLEEKTRNRFGDQGLAKIYGVGKRLGYRFCGLARLPKSEIRFSVKLLYDFIEAIYADKIETSIDLDQKILTIDTKGMLVLRRNGVGISLMVGGCAGIWGYFINDFDMSECGARQIEGEQYSLVAGPAEKLRGIGISFYESRGAPDLGDLKSYEANNQPPIVIPPGATNPDMLVNAKVLTNDKGPLKFSLPDAPLLSVEISWPFDLESTLGGDFVYEVAKETFASIGKSMPHKDKADEFLADLLTASGYGIVTIEKHISSETFHFGGAPWHYSAKDSSFPILRGAIEGFLEGQGGRHGKASVTRSELSNNRLTVAIDLA